MEQAERKSLAVPSDRVSSSRRRLNEARQQDCMYSPRSKKNDFSSPPVKMSLWECDSVKGDTERRRHDDETSSENWVKGSSSDKECEEAEQLGVLIPAPPSENKGRGNQRPSIRHTPQRGGGAWVRQGGRTGVVADRCERRGSADRGRTFPRDDKESENRDNVGTRSVLLEDRLRSSAASLSADHDTAEDGKDSKEESVRLVAEKFVGDIFLDCSSLLEKTFP